MATWLIITLSIVGAIAVGVLGYLLYRKADKTSDDLQRRINKLENMFAAAGSTWMSELLEDIVVGDASAITTKMRDIFEADNTTEFFVEKVARPCAAFVRKYDADRKKAVK